jgi:hypothetical protein
MKITRGGLHGYHWLIAIVLGFSTWIASAIFRCIPERMVP